MKITFHIDAREGVPRDDNWFFNIRIGSEKHLYINSDSQVSIEAYSIEEDYGDFSEEIYSKWKW